MRPVKVKFVGYWDNFHPDGQLIYEIMKKYYDVKIVEDADYVICSSCGDTLYKFCLYPQVRIFTSGENFTPDFNLVDYAITKYPIQFGDRHFRHVGVLSYHNGHCQALENRMPYTRDFLEQKKYFCNFIAGHESEYGIRGNFFKKLSEYKRVESVGSYLNNMPDGKCVSWEDSSKTDFQRQCKFTLCFESTSNTGFCTEKITDAFYAGTIPVYYGDPDIETIINPKAFINVANFPDWESAIQKIIELDQNDDAYMEMLNQPVYQDPQFSTKTLREAEKFVRHIFDQPLEQAYRRSRVYQPKLYNDYLEKLVREGQMTIRREPEESQVRRALRKAKNLLKKI